MRKGELVVGLAIALGAVGCQGAEKEGSGYLLLDREARAAGFAVESGNVRAAPVLPVELTSDTELSLTGPTGRVALSGADGELLHVRGAQGKIESREIGGDVEPDRLVLEGTEEAASALATALGGELTEAGDGRWELQADGALADSSRVEAPNGLLQILPAEPSAELEPVEAPADGAAAAMLGAGLEATHAGGFEKASIASAVAAMRKLDLPPAVSCADPVVGTWMTQQYDERYGDWYVFTLRVQRVRGSATELTGDIVAHSWDGGPADTAPRACDGILEHWKVGMTARGSIVGNEVHFGGTSWQPQQALCRRVPSLAGEYNLDQFDGSVVGSDFLAVNNDGDRMVDQPTPFRRVSCQ